MEFWTLVDSTKCVWRHDDKPGASVLSSCLAASPYLDSSASATITERDMVSNMRAALLRSIGSLEIQDRGSSHVHDIFFSWKLDNKLSPSETHLRLRRRVWRSEMFTFSPSVASHCRIFYQSLSPSLLSLYVWPQLETSAWLTYRESSPIHVSQMLQIEAASFVPIYLV